MNLFRSGQAFGKWGAALLLVAALATPRVASGKQAAVTEQDNAQAEKARTDAEEREQAKREADEEKREREQEKKEQEQEKAERQEELYSEGREALDENQYQLAAEKFSQLADLYGPQTDAALYWKAYAENKMGKRDSSLATIAKLRAKYAKSKWRKDADALEQEMRQSSGAPPNPDAKADEEIQALALQAVMNNDPARGIAIAEKKLNGTDSPKTKEKILFVIAQNGSTQAMETLGRIAQGQSNPELQRKAVEYLGIFGGERSKKTLGEIYAASNDESVKRAVLRSYMISGNRAGLFEAAKSEKNEGLKREAIRQLGLTGGTLELEQIYQADTSTESRREILQAFFLAGDSQRLAKAALGEKDVELRRAAIRNLGLMGGGKSPDTLPAIYAKETDRSLKEEVLNAYFIGGNAAALVNVAKTEKDPGLRKKAIEKLSLMNSKEGTEYLMELLQK